MNRVVALGRTYWRWLTSMRTALILLFLLAVAAIPGSLLPQKNISPERVSAYLQNHPTLGPWLNRLWFFEVFASPWFSAIYLLLFASLLGCLVPRLRQHLGALLAVPPDAPSRLERLPQHAADIAHDGDPGANAARLRSALKAQRWRTSVREQPDGSVTVSAEKGYVKETGNLLFHFALLAVLIGVAVGSWYGWHANRLVVQGDDFGFCDTPQQYDEYVPGARVSASDLPPFCVTVNSFRADYRDDGTPAAYIAQVSYVDGLNGPTKSKRLEVNDPLRLSGANVYLLGHGYAPVLRYTDKLGKVQTVVAPFLPDDAMNTGHGVAAFPDANRDPKSAPGSNTTQQVGFAGRYFPTLANDTTTDASVFPDERNPHLLLDAYVGNLGLDVGRSQSVYELDSSQIAAGRLAKVGEKMMKPGDSWTLPDGSTVEFLGTRPWITVAVRYDPGETVVLAGAVCLLVGLMISLTGRRRRVWARVSPAAGGGSLISLGGLPRSDYPGFAEEFTRIVALASPDTPPQTQAAPEMVHR
jgi:cytochrome c biogenesis protein